MKSETIINKYKTCKTAEQKYKFEQDLRSALKMIEEENKNTLKYCKNCKKHVFKSEVIEKFDIWTKRVCTNPLMGYLDDYEYEDMKFCGFRLYCPKCGKVIGERKL